MKTTEMMIPKKTEKTTEKASFKEAVLREQLHFAIGEATLEKRLALPQKRMTASERDAYGMMHVLWSICDDLVERSARRMAMIPGMKRDLRLMQRLLEKYVLRMRFTIPQEQRETVERHLDQFTYTVGVRNPLTIGKRKEDDWGLWMSFADLKTMVSTCHDFCMMCQEDLQGQRACPLRRVFDHIGADAQERADGCCEYREYM